MIIKRVEKIPNMCDLSQVHCLKQTMTLLIKQTMTFRSEIYLLFY